MLRTASTITIFTLLIPTICIAEKIAVWDFQTGNAPREIQKSTNIDVRATGDGLLVTARDGGNITFDTSAFEPFDVVTLIYSAPEHINPGFVWHPEDLPKDALVVAPIILDASEHPRTADFDLNRYNEWTRTTTRFGMAFEKGQEITIQGIEFKGFGLTEKISEAWKSFWTFDRFRPSSINFLWGPQIAFTTTARKQMFSEVLPVAHSGNWFFYGVMALVVVIFSVSKIFNFQFSIFNSTTVLLCSIASLWILYDIRMGSEFLSHIKRDYETYWSKEPGERTFRERRFFFDFAFQVAPIVKGEQHYAFLSHERWPFLGLMRYYTYPSIPQTSGHGVRTWAIYRRPDITVNVHGQLEENGKLISTSGKVIHEFEEGTFLFRTNPPPEVR